MFSSSLFKPVFKSGTALPAVPLVFLFMLFSGAVAAQCKLSGQVTDSQGAPLNGASIRIVELATGTVSDAQGRYVYDQLPAGQYTLQTTYLGYETAVSSLLVPTRGGQCTLDVQLTEKVFTTDELTVTAVRVNERTPMSFVTLKRADLQPRNLGQDAPFLMQWTPSAVVTSDAGTGIGYTGIWIRGADPTRTNITINGIPLNDAESQAVFWVNLPDFLSSAEEVQIQRGVGASTNGPGAFGATVNINTQKVYEQPYTSMDATAGSFNTLRASMRFGTGLINNRFTLDGRLSRISSDGYIDRASADLKAWYVSGAYIGDKSSLRINAFQGSEVTYQAWYGISAELAENPDTRTTNVAGTEKPGDPYDNEVDDYGQTHLQLLYNHQFNPAWRLNLAAYYTRGGGFFEQYKAEEDPASYGFSLPPDGPASTDLIRRRWLQNHLLGATYGLHYLNDRNGLQLTLGGAYSRYDGRHFGEVIWARYAGSSEIRHRYYDNDGLKTDFNVFVKANYPLSARLEAYADLQARQVNYQFKGYDDELQLVDQQEGLLFINPKLGLLYKTNSHSQAYLSFGVAQREPNRNDYVDNPPAVRPQPEQLYNTELGWRYKSTLGLLEANVYHMYYRNQLALNGQLNDVGEYLRINIDRSYRLGLELNGARQWGRYLRTEANVAISQNKVVAFTEYIDQYDADFNYLGQEPVERRNTPLSFSPGLVAALSLAYRLPLGNLETTHWETALQAKYVSKRYLDNSADEQNVIDPFAFADLRLSYRRPLGLIRTLRLSLVIQNLLDAQIETNGWSYRYQVGDDLLLDRGLYPQAGRNWLLAVGLDF